MKRILALALATILLLGMLAGCSGKETANTPAETTTNEAQTSADAATEAGSAIETAKASLQEYYAKAEPLGETVKINYGDGVGYQLSVPIYIAWKTGALQDCGIELNWIPSANGPLRVEALAAGEVDLFGSGIGGIATGCAQNVAMMIAYINDDSVVQKFYVAGDDPLASAAENDAGFRGTADDWKGREVYMQAGSTLQYLLGHCMKNIGLTLQDLTPVYMDAPNVSAAMYAGKGETWGVWNFQCYDEDLDAQGFVPVIQGYDAGIRLATAYGTSEAVWNDTSKRAAIEKILELHFLTLEWMQASEENMQTAAQILTDWGAAEGTAIPYEENLAYLKETHYYTLEENMDAFTTETTNEHGTMCNALDMLMGIMDFYVEQGNYQESDRENMIENQKTLFNKEGLEHVSALLAK